MSDIIWKGLFFFLTQIFAQAGFLQQPKFNLYFFLIFCCHKMPNGYKKHDRTFSKLEQFGSSSSHLLHRSYTVRSPLKKIDASKDRFLLRYDGEDFFVQPRYKKCKDKGGRPQDSKDSRAICSANIGSTTKRLPQVIHQQQVLQQQQQVIQQQVLQDDHCCRCPAKRNIVPVALCQHLLCQPCAKLYYGSIRLDLYPLHCPICPARVNLNLLRPLSVLPSCFQVLAQLAQFMQLYETHCIYQCSQCLHLHNIPRTPFVLETKCEYCSGCGLGNHYILSGPDVYCPSTTRFYKWAQHCLRCNVHYFKTPSYYRRHDHIRRHYRFYGWDNNNIPPAVPGLPVNLAALLERMAQYEQQHANHWRTIYPPPLPYTILH